MKCLPSLLPLFLAVSPVFAATPDKPKTQNVILITLDGMRWQEVFNGAEAQLMNKTNGNVSDTNLLTQEFWRETSEARRAALLPFLWLVVARDGQMFGNTNRGSIARITNDRKFSYPGYSEILTGHADPRINSNDKTNNPNITVLEWLHQKPSYRQRVAAFTSWDVFPYIINRQRSGVFVNSGVDPIIDRRLTEREEFLNELMIDATPIWSGVRSDALTFHAALEHFKKHKPRVLYVAFDETDDWAHDGRYDRYLRAANHIDRFIRTLWETAQSMSQYRGKTSLLITADHGRGDGPTGWREHGEKTAGAEYIWLGVLGPDTPSLGERSNVEPITQSQVAATLAALLGQDYRQGVPYAGKPIASVINPLATQNARQADAH
jgi:hypothetical protein